MGGPVFTVRLWYVPNPREIGLGGGAPAVQIRLGASELLRKCCSEPGTPKVFLKALGIMNRERELGLDRRETG